MHHDGKGDYQLVCKIHDQQNCIHSVGNEKNYYENHLCEIVVETDPGSGLTIAKKKPFNGDGFHFCKHCVGKSPITMSSITIPNPRKRARASGKPLSVKKANVGKGRTQSGNGSKG